MANVTQQLIALFKNLTALHGDLGEINHSIKADIAERRNRKNEEGDKLITVKILREPGAETAEIEGRNAGIRAENRDRRRLLIERIALFVGATVAVANFGLWIETAKSSRIAATAAKAAQEGARASSDQASATRQSIEATVSNFRLDQRAWVGINALNLTVLKNSEPLRAEGDVFNTGKIPALNLRLEKSGIQTNYGPLDIDKFIASGKLKKPHGTVSNSVLLPNGSAKIPFQTDQNLTDTFVAQIIDHTLWVYLFGDIHYRDVFGREHVTRFCGIYDPPTRRFDNCPSHIDVN